jgi:HSP20 family protein
MSSLIFGNSRRGSLLGWDPLRLFDDLVPAGSPVLWSAYESPVRVRQDDDATVITVDMPGVADEDVELTFQSGDLTISGKRDERVYSYRVTLGDAYDADGIEAALDKGVLTVRASKRPEAKPRKILLSGGRSQKQLGGGEK